MCAQKALIDGFQRKSYPFYRSNDLETQFAQTVIADAVPPPGSVAPMAQYAVTTAFADDVDPLNVLPSVNTPLYIADNSKTTTD